MKSKLLLLPAILWMFAITANPQVTVNVTNKSVRETLKRSRKKASINSSLTSRFAGLEKRTSLKVNDADITQVMSTLLAGTDIDYRIEENNLIVLVSKSATAARQSTAQQSNRTVTGTITDASGEPIIVQLLFSKMSLQRVLLPILMVISLFQITETQFFRFHTRL